MISSIEKIGRLFPERAFMIGQMVRRNSAFRTMCEEYDLAATALLQLEDADGGVNRDRIEEYRSLIEEIKAEIERTLYQPREASRR